ncbi:MAG: ABC transporter permease [Dehalococcoidia bacterium]
MTTLVLRQTGAILLDAYRELNSRKLFWFALVISGLIVAAFAAIGMNERGLTLLWWEFENDINTRIVPAAWVYKVFFALFAVPIWLAWGAIILAIVSTAGLIPEFLAGGAVELSLSKPIGRLRLILTKFFAAMLFTGLQVAVFATACFLVVGLRGDAWEPRLFLAVPLVLLVFSYLYSICFLLGMLTRSTLAAMLLTFLIWMVIVGLNATETVFYALRTQNERRQATLAAQIERRQSRRTALESEGQPTTDVDEQVQRLTDELNNEAKPTGENLRVGHTISLAVKTVLPKTQDTIDLLGRVVLSENDRRFLNTLTGADRNRRRRQPSADDEGPITPSTAERVEQGLRSRSWVWIVGTSLGFEAVVVGLGAWHFCRRDF